MEGSNPIWIPKTIAHSGNIRKINLDGTFFEGRLTGDEVRAKISINYIIEHIFQNTGVRLKSVDILRLKLGHTNIVKKLTKEDINKYFQPNERGVNVSKQKMDALVMPLNEADSFSHLMAIGTADCAPIIIRSNKLVGIAHSGHKGLADGIIKNLADATHAIESSDRNLRIAIAPMAEKLLFPLSFEDKIPSDFYNLYRDLGFIQTLKPGNKLRGQIFDNDPSSEDKLYFNIISIIIHQLLKEFKISESSIELSNIDTTKDSNSYSYRRDKNDPDYSNNYSYSGV